VLKTTAFCLYTGGESCTPLIYRFVYDVLSNAVSHTQQALTQLVDVIYAFLVDPLLHYSLDLIDTITLSCWETPDFISPDQWPPNYEPRGL